MKQDRQSTLNRAMQLFWAKGFHATSMRHLQEAVDMRPGSLYALFGSKEGIFREVLRHYTERGQKQLEACVRGVGSPLKGLEAFFRKILLEQRHSAPSDQCLLAKTVLELDESHGELLEEARSHLRAMEERFAVLLAQSQSAGELPGESDPRILARYLQIQLMGLRTWARLNDDDAMIAFLVDELFERLRSGQILATFQIPSHLQGN